MFSSSTYIQPSYQSKKVVCIVDDDFLSPAQQLEMELFPVLLNNHIERMLEQEWDDIAIKNLCKNLLKSGWNIQAFSSPKQYVDKIEEDIYISDILIFDWEYRTGEIDQVGVLQKILTQYPVFVYIFSGADTEDEVQCIIENELGCFKERIKYLSKCVDDENTDAAEDLSNQLDKMKENNFSFYFGSGFRKIVANSVENILVKFADLKLEKVITLLSHEENINELKLEIKDIISSKVTESIRASSEIRKILSQENIKEDVIDELIGILEGKIRNSIISSRFPLPKSEGTSYPEKIDTDIIRKLWSFRLYYKPSNDDNVVRTGDIIIHKDSMDFSCLYLVLTDNCSLSRFSKKTANVLNTVKLKQLTSLETEELKVNSPTSLTNIMGFSSTEGRPLLLPYVPIDESHMEDYVLFMQEHYSIENKSEKSISQLTYDDVEYSRICSVSVPFLYPLIGTVITNLFGWGCSDYPKEVQDDIKERVKKVVDQIKSEKNSVSSKKEITN